MSTPTTNAPAPAPKMVDEEGPVVGRPETYPPEVFAKDPNKMKAPGETGDTKDAPAKK